MNLFGKVDKLASTISEREIDAYLTDTVKYADLKELSDGTTDLGAMARNSSYRIEMFYVINEDIPISSVGTIANTGLSFLLEGGNNSIQIYRKSGGRYIPTITSAQTIRDGYILLGQSYISPAAYFGIDYIEGRLSLKTKKLYKLYNIRTAVALKQKVSYSSLANLNSEIERILYSVSPKVTTYEFKQSDGALKLLDGTTEVENVVSLGYDLDGNLTSYVTNDEVEHEIPYSDSSFVTFIKNISNNSYGEEFTNINGRKANMMTTSKIAIYSALLNFSKDQLETTKVYLKYLKTVYNNNILYDNWDEFRTLFNEFLKQVSERTIHY